jgi:hypothetical protein
MHPRTVVLMVAAVSMWTVVQTRDASARCINTEKSCSAALSFCLHRTNDNAADCRATHTRCMKDGSWHSAFCNRDGLMRR